MRDEPGTAEHEPTNELAESTQALLHQITLILVSNRGPVEFQLEPDGSFSSRRGSGGVVTAVSAVTRYTNPIWIASAMGEGDRLRWQWALEHGEPLIQPEGSDFRLQFIVPDPDAYDLYYNRIANPLLWFLQHYLWDTPRSPDVDPGIWDAWEHGYVEVNRLFAHEILAAINAAGPQRPVVMLQDYHLYLVPGIVRAQRPDVVLQHFIHIPWPDPDYWNLIPQAMRVAICESMLGNDIVGFQTRNHARSFMNTCETNLEDVDLDYRNRAIHYRGHTTFVRAYPISIDAAAVELVASSEDAQRHEEHLDQFWNEYIIIRVDRAEPSKNIVRGFLAYDLFLEQHPEFLGRVSFLAFLVPSRLEVAEYIDYLDDINTIVGRINTKYANAAERDGVPWQPITLFIGDDYPRALAAMKRYDALLVNAIFDGMNLVAKEGALLNQRDGVLILSEVAGSHQQLGPFALTVSPTDIQGTANAIHRAFTLDPALRAKWAENLRTLVRTQDLVTWIEQQLSDVADVLVERDQPGA